MSDVKIPEDLLQVAREVIAMESRCIEWGATADRSVALAAEQIDAFVRKRIAALEAENARRQEYDNIVCGYCQGTMWCHSPEQLAYCQKSLAAQKEASGAECCGQGNFGEPHDCEKQPPLLRVRGGTLEDFKDACTAPPSYAALEAQISMLLRERDALKAQAERLTEALRRIIRDFETDFVLDGVVVDKPCTSHLAAWEVAKEALAARASKKEEK